MLTLNEPNAAELVLDSVDMAHQLELKLTSAPPLVLAPAMAPLLDLLPHVGLSNSDSSSKLPLPQLIVGGVVSLALVAGGGFGTYQFAMKKSATAAIESAGYEAGSEGLIQAISAGQVELIPAYERLGFHLGSTPRVIEAAFMSGSGAVIEQVLAGGAMMAQEPNAGALLQMAVESDNPALIDILGRLQPFDANDVLPQIKHVIAGGKWKAFERLAVQDVYLKFVSSNGETVAHVAGLSDSPDLVNALNSSGKVDMKARNAQGQTALHFSVNNDKPASTAALVSLGLDPLQVDSAGRSALMIAWERGRDAVIASLISGNKSAINQLMSQDLSEVYRSDAVLTAKALIVGGLKIDEPLSNGHTPLFAAVQSSNMVMASLLLDSGASPDAISDIRDVQGVTPLMIACATGNTLMVKLLLERGASKVVVASNGATALSIARGIGKADVIDLLNNI